MDSPPDHGGNAVGVAEVGEVPHLFVKKHGGRDDEPRVTGAEAETQTNPQSKNHSTGIHLY